MTVNYVHAAWWFAAAGCLTFLSTGAAAAAVPPPDADAAAPAAKRITRVEDLGELPFEVRWPAPPKIEREVVVNAVEEYWEQARQSGTRFRIKKSLPGQFTIQASDVEVVLEDGVRLERIFVARGLKRVRVVGGEVGGSNYGFAIKVGGYHRGGSTRPGVNKWDQTIVEDVVFDGVTVRAATTGFRLRGRRVAVLNCDVVAGKNGVLCWIRSSDYPCEDVIVAGCNVRSAGLGGEATVRLENVQRAAVVGNTLSHPVEDSHVAFHSCGQRHAARNELGAGGLKLAPDDRQELETAWNAHDYVEVLRLLAAAEGRETEPAAEPSGKVRHDAFLAEYDRFRAGWLADGGASQHLQHGARLSDHPRSSAHRERPEGQQAHAERRHRRAGPQRHRCTAGHIQGRQPRPRAEGRRREGLGTVEAGRG